LLKLLSVSLGRHVPLGGIGLFELSSYVRGVQGGCCHFDGSEKISATASMINMLKLFEKLIQKSFARNIQQIFP
jgi:hypothetical protein